MSLCAVPVPDSHPKSPPAGPVFGGRVKPPGVRTLNALTNGPYDRFAAGALRFQSGFATVGIQRGKLPSSRTRAARSPIASRAARTAGLSVPASISMKNR